MKELTVYSTVAGNLPTLVRNKDPMCFVPYIEAYELQNELAQLKLHGKLDVDKILEKYLAQVDQISEEFPDKSGFSAEEIVQMIVKIIEEQY